MLTNFESMNEILKDYDVKFFEYYEESRFNFIKILNDIVDNYTYKTPELNEALNYKGDLDYLKEENEALREELSRYKDDKPNKSKISPSNTMKTTSPLKKLESFTQNQDKKDKLKLKSKSDYGNNLLRWSNAKDFNQAIQQPNYRGLSLKQLKEFIAELYEAKALYDTGCRKQYQPLETLEQFMYNHLKYKYGLNNLVIEWVFAVVEAVKIHSVSDNDVALFGLVYLLGFEE